MPLNSGVRLLTVLSRLRQAFAVSRAAHEANRETWELVAVPGLDGLTEFQRLAAKALAREFGSFPLKRHGESEYYLHGGVPGTSAEVFVYEDGGEVSNCAVELRAERWDYSTPEELIKDLVAYARRAAI